MKNSISIAIAFILIACQNGSGRLATLYNLPKKLKVEIIKLYKLFMKYFDPKNGNF